MKKYIAIILLIGITLAGFLVYYVIKTNKSNRQSFAESGYILQSGNQNKTAVDRFYFKANESYKKNYMENIEFSNTDGEKVETNQENFIHYSNGSIGAFKNGVLINLNQINDKLITYYNISKRQTLERKNNAYSISHLGKDLVFSSLLWKISNNKYLIASDNITLSLGNNEEKKNIKGYIEIEYQDNEVVKIYNQEISFLTISPDSYVDIQGNIKIDLSNRIVSYAGENKLSIDSMVIDSEDNVNIVDLDQYNVKNEIANNNIQSENITNETENTTENTVANETNSVNVEINRNINENNDSGNGNGEVTVIINDDSSGNSQQSTSNSSQTIINNGATNNFTDEENEEESDEEIIDESSKINTPEFKVVDFETTPFGLTANVSINDKDALLSEDTKIEIMEEETGRKVYENSSSLGIYDFTIEANGLLPNTNYVLTISSAYAVDSINYNKNFIYKIFNTKPLGVTITKDASTENSISISVDYEKDAIVESLEVELMDSNGNVVSSKASSNLEKVEKSEILEFTDLNANSEYTAVIKNIIADGQTIASSNGETKTFKTLKRKPTLSNPEFEIDKRNSVFKLQLGNLIDIDDGITDTRFEVYDIKDLEQPVLVMNTEKTATTLAVDSVNIFRDVGYVYKVVAAFSDNEKSIEYESEFSDIMKLDGSIFPTLSWNEEEVTFERIKGVITIHDEDNAVGLKQNDTIKVSYKDSVGEERFLTSQGSLNIPIDVNNLRKNETYRFSVYANIDLHDGNDPIDECYIGSILVKTKEPKNMVATFLDNKEDVKNAFSINFELGKEKEDQGELEPSTLTGISISIYAGQSVDGNLPSGTPKKVMKMLDGNTEPYTSELKDKMYDNVFKITPETFGSQNTDFRDKYYTIVVGDAYDYTDYQNGLPILRNIYTFETNGYMPDLPGDINDALLVTVIRNRDVQNPRSDLEASTIVGYQVRADFINTNNVAREYIYKAYDANTNQLVKTKRVSVDKYTYDVPSVIFDVNDGVYEESNDGKELRRGNKYYFTYEVMVALSPTDDSILTHFPEDGITLKSKTQRTEKQEAKIEMYPLNSHEYSYTIAYRITDVDYSIDNNNVIAKINEVPRTTQRIEKNTSEFLDFTLTNISKGNLKLVINQRTLFDEPAKETECIKNYFEGINSISNLSYTTKLEENKIKIQLDESNSQLSKILGYKAVFTSDDGTEVVKDLLVSEDNVIEVKYSSISALKGKDITLKLYGYYDTGISGYQLDPTKYVTYQKPYLDTDEIIYYYQIDKDNHFINSPKRIGNIYSSTRNGERLTIVNQCDTQKVATIDLEVTEQGFVYDGNVVLQKQVDIDEIKNKDNSNTFRFDNVITEIKVRNSNGDNDIDSELTSASFYAELSMVDIISDGKITIEVYQTDENGRTAELKKSIVKEIAEFDKKVVIDDLAPKTYYFLKFKANFNGNNGPEEMYLYDGDYNVSGKQYFFSTLAFVQISNLNVQYKAKSYNDKELNITYDLEKIMGYSAITYQLQEYNEETEEYEDTNISIEPSIRLETSMEKSVPIIPSENVAIKFNTNYKLIVTPIVELDGVTYEVGKGETEFNLNSPTKPQVIIRANRANSKTVSRITASITVYDRNYTVPSQKYSFKIQDGQGRDVTPEEYKNKQYDISKLKQNFTIDNLDINQDYVCCVIMDIDMNNNTITEKYTRTKTKSKTDSSGIIIGDISAQNNFANGIHKVKLFFNESVNLNEVTEIKYTIYNDSGYIVNGKDSEFKPTLETQNIYSYLIDNNMNNCENGEYYIELQFYKDEDLIDTDTITFTFII